MRAECTLRRISIETARYSTIAAYHLSIRRPQHDDPGRRPAEKLKAKGVHTSQPPHVFLPAVRAWTRLRVRFVIALAAALLLAVPARVTDAQQGSSLNSLPRYALVIGNSKYADAPLKNPRNDAEAIAGALKKIGFKVQLKFDVSRDEMIEAIRAYSNELTNNKAVGLFYYAGHGAQLSWRNYPDSGRCGNRKA